MPPLGGHLATFGTNRTDRGTRSSMAPTDASRGRDSMTAVDRRAAFRRTRRTAVGVVGAALLTFMLTEPGSAAPGTASQDSGFNNGTGSAIALGYKANPTNGNLSFGITAGESVSGHQNTAATGQSRAINLGVIGVTLAGEGC